MDPALRKLSHTLSERSNSPISRSGTPGLTTHPPNIAPQHMFDSVSLDGPSFHSPSLPQFTYRAPSPAGSANGSHLEPPPTHETLTQLKTRISELEVINGLFRGRVSELESSEAMARDNENRARQDLHMSKRRIESLEAELAEYRDSAPRHKRVRMSDLVDDSPESTPLSTPPHEN